MKKNTHTSQEKNYYYYFSWDCLYPLNHRFAGFGILFLLFFSIYSFHFKEAKLTAEPFGAKLTDSDSDLLPDSLEWVSLSNPKSSDSDLDGVDDFSEVVHYGFPSIKDNPKINKVGFRVLFNLEPNLVDSKRRDIWIHCLFQLPGAKIKQLKAFSLFVDIGGIRYPLGPLMRQGFRQFASKLDNAKGLFLRYSYCFTVDAAFIPNTMTISGVSIINNSVFKAGSLLINDQGSFLTLVNLGTKKFGFQTAGRFEATNPFWSKNRVCVFALDTQTIGRSGVLCEVISSKCEAAIRFKCAPNCLRMKGLTFILPDGLGAISGG
jgi:hypothetical protein